MQLIKHPINDDLVNSRWWDLQIEVGLELFDTTLFKSQLAHFFEIKQYLKIQWNFFDVENVLAYAKTKMKKL